VSVLLRRTSAVHAVSRRIDDILYVAGRSPVENQTESLLMFIAGAVDEVEATQHRVTTFGFKINQPAEYLKGATGIIKDVALRAGTDLDRCYDTVVCKWLAPPLRDQRCYLVFSVGWRKEA
jgi:hypothetical protein